MRRCFGVYKSCLIGIVLVQRNRALEWSSIMYSSRIESWNSVRLQRGKNVKSHSREEVPRLIDLLGPVTVLKRAKHDFQLAGALDEDRQLSLHLMYHTGARRL